MGLFSKSPAPPAPVITVNLNTPQDHVFKPNDIVAGHITLSTPIPLNPLAIEASLWGKSIVWIRHSHSDSDNSTSSYTHYRDDVSLFNITFNVLTEKYLQPGPVYTFPFHFVMPERTLTSRVGGYKDDNNTLFTVHPHPLPPTFMWGDQIDYPDHAMFTYGVTGRLLCPGVGGGKKGDQPIESIAPIIFSPHNPRINQPFTVLPHTKNFTLSSSTLAGQAHLSIGFRKKLSDRFSSSTPKLDFQFGIQVPDYLTTGLEFRFGSTFTVLNKSDNVVAIPTLTFKVLKLELRDLTYMRAPQDLYARSDMMGTHDKSDANRKRVQKIVRAHEDFQHREKKTVLNTLPESRVVTLDEVMVPGEKKGSEQAGSCEAWFSARVPGFIPPSFQSFAIHRSYMLKVKMGLEIGGKKFDYEIESVVNGMGST